MKALKFIGTSLFSLALMSFSMLDAAAIANWTQTQINLGEIEQNVPATATFDLTNDGDAPLIISEVKPSCGCTVADYPREPIAPGETVQITARYNARTLGTFRKSIAVTTNAETSTYQLIITGKVVE